MVPFGPTHPLDPFPRDLSSISFLDLFPRSHPFASSLHAVVLPTSCIAHARAKTPIWQKACAYISVNFIAPHWSCRRFSENVCGERWRTGKLALPQYMEDINASATEGHPLFSFPKVSGNKSIRFVSSQPHGNISRALACGAYSSHRTGGQGEFAFYTMAFPADLCNDQSFVKTDKCAAGKSDTKAGLESLAGVGGGNSDHKTRGREDSGLPLIVASQRKSSDGTSTVRRRPEVKWLSTAVVGQCGFTDQGNNDCNKGDRGSYELPYFNGTRGSWKTAVRYCIKQCAACGRCNVISVSVVHRDCSWYYFCDLRHTDANAEGAKFLSGAVQVGMPAHNHVAWTLSHCLHMLHLPLIISCHACNSPQARQYAFLLLLVLARGMALLHKRLCLPRTRMRSFRTREHGSVTVT